MEKYSNYDIDLIQSYWVDSSQDVDWITDQVEFSKKEVEEILDYLSKKGMIEGWNINESIINRDDFPGGDDNRYFYDKKEINEEYDNNIFQILAKTIYVNETNDGLIIDCLVSFKHLDYPIVILYFNDEEMYYGSRGDEWDRLVKALGPRYTNFLESLLHQILKDHVPYNFWKVRGIHN
jgi:hypothetical protein